MASQEASLDVEGKSEGLFPPFAFGSKEEKGEECEAQKHQKLPKSEKERPTPLFLPDVLCLSSGGEKGFMMLGVLFYLHRNGLLRNIKTYIGSSVGSMINYLLAIGYTPLEICVVALTTSLLKDYPGITIQKIIENYGLIDHRELQGILEELSRMKLGYVPTLSQLFEKGITLIATTVNISEEKVEYLSASNYPDLSGPEAVMMSITIPFIFAKKEYKGCFYVDGALGDPFPLLHLDDGKRNILGIAVEVIRSKNIESITEFCYRIALASMKEIKRSSKARASQRCKALDIKSESVSILSYGDTFPGRIGMFCKGLWEGVRFGKELGIQLKFPRLPRKAVEKQESPAVRKERLLAKEKRD